MNAITSSKVKPIFLIGIPRSGSTLWHRVIAQDKSVYCFGEMHYLSLGRKDFRNFLKENVRGLSDDRNITILVDKLMSEESWPGLRGGFWKQIRRVEPDLLAARMHERLINSDRSLESIFRILVEEPTIVRGYERCFVKFPVYFTQVKRLFDWFPGAPIINVTRDPRAIAASKTNDPGGTAKLLKEQHWLRWPLRLAMMLFVVVQYQMSGRIHVHYKDRRDYNLFLYEDLLANPEDTLRKLCEFANLEYSPEMLQPKAGERSSLTGARRGGLDVSGASRWKEALSPMEITIITALTGAARIRLEFDPDQHPIYKHCL